LQVIGAWHGPPFRKERGDDAIWWRFVSSLLAVIVFLNNGEQKNKMNKNK